MASNRPKVEMCESLLCVLKERDYLDQLEKREEYEERLRNEYEAMKEERDQLREKITNQQETIAELQCETQDLEEEYKEKADTLGCLNEAYDALVRSHKKALHDQLQLEKQLAAAQQELIKAKEDRLQSDKQQLGVVNRVGDEIREIRSTLNSMIEECKNKPE